MIDDRGQRARRTVESLVSEGLLEPLDEGPSAARAWVDCELATLIENRFFLRVDPSALEGRDRAAWLAKATAPGERWGEPRGRSGTRAPFWLVDRGQRVGTVGVQLLDGGEALGRGGPILGVSSFFVRPEHRARGIGSRALRRIDAAGRARGTAGTRVATHWSWQSAVRFYVFGLGMWVVDWRSALVFAVGEGLPEHVLDFAATRAHFDRAASRDAEPSGRERLLTAERDGERLVWRETVAMKRLDARDPLVAQHARRTLSVALALQGFPLVRSGKHWRVRRALADVGEPEGLAHKIAAFERRDRRCGFEVRTPRIPGLRAGIPP